MALAINDLTIDTALDAKAMTDLAGGHSYFGSLYYDKSFTSAWSGWEWYYGSKTGKQQYALGQNHDEWIWWRKRSRTETQYQAWYYYTDA